MRGRVAQRFSLLDHRLVIHAPVPLSREALLNATCPGFIFLVTLVPTVRATFGCHAIVANVGAILDPRIHFDKAALVLVVQAALVLVVAIVCSVANPDGVARPVLLLGVHAQDRALIAGLHACGPIAILDVALVADISAAPQGNAIFSLLSAPIFLPKSFAGPRPVSHFFRGGGRACFQT